MRLRAFIMAIITLATCVAAAPQSDPKSKALDWLTRVGAAATEEIATAQADLAKAKEAIQIAQHAVVASREQHDAELEARANGALATSQAEAARAQERIATAQARVAKIKSVMADIVPGATGVALEMKGTATILSNGESKVWNGSPAALKPGDLITTGKGGRLVMVFDDGRFLTLGESATFQFLGKPGTPADAPLLERAIGYLRSGTMRLNKRVELLPFGNPRLGPARAEVDYRTPTAVAAVRGTEFQLTAIANQPTRFVPISGEVEIKADAEGLKGYTPNVWWPSVADATSAPAQGVVVLSVTGVAQVEDAAGKREVLAAGRLIGTGKHVITDSKGIVLLKTADGYKLALAGDTRLDLAQDPKSKAAVYILRQGRTHVWGDGASSSTRFLTPNSVTAASAKEFEVSVGAGGVAEYLPINGSLSVTAVASRLDWSKLPELRAN